MDKRYLASLPVKKQKPLDSERLTAELIETKKEQVLCLTIYDIQGDHTHRIFINKTMWHTLSADGKWSKITLGRIKHGENHDGSYGYGLNDDAYIIDKDSKKVIEDYIGKDGWRNPFDKIQQLMRDINYEKYSNNRYNQERKKQLIFDRVPQLPNNINQWVKDELMPRSRYIFMQAKKSGKAHKEAFCTYCRNNLDISADYKHNETGHCEKCGSEVIYKSAGMKRRSMKDCADFYIFQRADKDIFIRFFTAIIDYDCKVEHENFIYQEYARYYITNNNMILWTQKFVRTGGWGWDWDRYEIPSPCGWIKKKFFIVR